MKVVLTSKVAQGIVVGSYVTLCAAGIATFVCISRGVNRRTKFDAAIDKLEAYAKGYEAALEATKKES